MKQLTIIFAAAVIFLTASSFTASSPAPSENENVAASFKKDFSNAAEVTWKEKGGFFFAYFNNGGVKTEAAYDWNGNLIGTGRCIYTKDLPAPVLDALTEKFPNDLIGSHVTELVVNDEASYTLSVSNTKHMMYVTVEPDLSITIDRKFKIKND